MHQSFDPDFQPEVSPLPAQQSLPALVNDMSLGDLLPVAAKVFRRQVELAHQEVSLMLDLLRLKGEEELATGQAMRHSCVEVQKQRNGFVRVKFTP